MSLINWLADRREEILALSIAYEQEAEAPLADAVVYPLWQAVLTAMSRVLERESDHTLSSIQLAQRALELRLDLPTYIRCLNTLRRAAQYILSQDVHTLSEQLAWMGTLNDFLFNDCQAAATILGSGSLARLAEERHLLRTLMDAMPDFIWAKDLDSKFLMANLAQVALMGGASVEDVLGKDDADFFPAADAAKYRADEIVVIESGVGKVGIEEQVRNAQGNIRWMQATKMPFRDSQGQIVGVFGIVRDVTDIRLAQERDRLQREVIEAQRQTLAELSTPIIPIMDRIIVMPLVGAVDSTRAQDIMRSLLAGISQYRARIAILDITGVPIVDSGVADHLNRTIQAARLKGTQTIITGVSDAVAETVVDLGIDWSGVDVQRDLQSGLMAALKRLGFQLARAAG